MWKQKAEDIGRQMISWAGQDTAWQDGSLTKKIYSTRARGTKGRQHKSWWNKKTAAEKKIRQWQMEKGHAVKKEQDDSSWTRKAWDKGVPIDLDDEEEEEEEPNAPADGPADKNLGADKGPDKDGGDGSKRPLACNEWVL